MDQPRLAKTASWNRSPPTHTHVHRPDFPCPYEHSIRIDDERWEPAWARVHITSVVDATRLIQHHVQNLVRISEFDTRRSSKLPNFHSFSFHQGRMPRLLCCNFRGHKHKARMTNSSLMAATSCQWFNEIFLPVVRVGYNTEWNPIQPPTRCFFFDKCIPAMGSRMKHIVPQQQVMEKAAYKKSSASPVSTQHRSITTPTTLIIPSVTISHPVF